MRRDRCRMIVAAAVFLLALCSCGGRQTPEQAPAMPDPQLSIAYEHAVVGRVHIEPEFSQHYPDAAGQCYDGLLSELRSRSTFKTVAGAETAAAGIPGTLFIKPRILSMRIVSGAARFWWGAAAGRSNVAVELELVDAATDTTVRRKTLTSSNNPFGAVWTGGSSDKSLPWDMGRIMAAYVMAVNPKK
jgi:hypothetical protein